MGERHAHILTDTGAAGESSDHTTDQPRHTVPGRLPAEAYDDHGGAEQSPYERDGITVRRHGPEAVHVAWLKSGQWLAYDTTVDGAGVFELTVRVAADPEYGGGSMVVTCDGTRVGRLQFVPTRGWYDWEFRSLRVGLAAGEHRVRVIAEEGGWSLDWIEIKRPSSD